MKKVTKKFGFLGFFSYIYYVNKKDMIKQKQSLNTAIEIDLTGPEGNAFYLLGFATKLGKTLGMDWSSICDEMRSGDYENLVQVFDNNFGHLVTLYR